MSKYSQKIKQLFIILLGNMLYAFAVAYFILPVGLITGGTTGIAIFINHHTGLEISLFVSAFNCIMFLIGVVTLGKKFAMTTIISTFVYPIFLRFAQTMVAQTGVLTEDNMLSTVFAGLLIGLGIGMVIQEGASTGGMDIPPLVLNKKTGISVAFLLNAFDIIILLLQVSFSSSEQILYGILMVCIYTVVLEKILVLGKNKVQIKIISTKYQEINEQIANTLDRGTTLYKIEGGHTRRDMYAVLTVVSQRELFQVNELAQKIDPDAFIIIGKVTEVKGRGFTKGKKYE